MLSIKDYKTKRRLRPEIVVEPKKLKNKQTADRRKMLYKRYRSIYDFTKFRTIHAFKNGIITMSIDNLIPTKKIDSLKER